MLCTFGLTDDVHIMHFMVMTKLDQWLGDKRDDSWLAEKLGCSRSQASRIRRGKSFPSLETAVAIERLTKGKVRPADFVVKAIDPVPANDNPSVERAA